MTFSLFSEFLSEGKAKQPKMEYPGIKVSMLQFWKTKLPNALSKLGYSGKIISQGYDDAYTKWAVAIEIPKKFNIDKFEDALRDELSFDGWLSVEFFDLTKLDESVINEADLGKIPNFTPPKSKEVKDGYGTHTEWKGGTWHIFYAGHAWFFTQKAGLSFKTKKKAFEYVNIDNEDLFMWVDEDGVVTDADLKEKPEDTK